MFTGEWTPAGGFKGFEAPKKLPVAVRLLKLGCSQLELANFREDVRNLASFAHLNVVRLLGVTYVDNNTQIGAVYDYAVHGDLVQWLRMRRPME